MGSKSGDYAMRATVVSHTSAVDRVSELFW